MLVERLLGLPDLIRRRPAATYRLQLTPEHGFQEAAKRLPYLAELGVTDVYLSPILAATPGSPHGYDVVGHDLIRPELGGEEGFLALSAEARRYGLGLVVDVVPNHMGIGPTNAWWVDVLENGPSSVYAPYFDVDWTPLKKELTHKVLVPVLGDQYGEVLERGELRLERAGGAFCLSYYDHRFPISPRSVPRILTHGLDALTAELGEADVHLQELLSIITALEKLAPRHEVDPEKVAERAREKEVAKRRLAALVEAHPRIQRHVDDALSAFNGRAGDAHSFDLLDALLDAQAYRLAHWRVAGEEINYRRFFDVNTLAAIRMEDERVFAATHRTILSLVTEGHILGLRIDHPDGLYRPTNYFRSLQVAYLVARARKLFEGTDAEFAALESELRTQIEAEMAAGRLPKKPLVVVAEKILEGQERMPAGWQVDGTTGYEFLGCVNGLFVDARARRELDDLYARVVGQRVDFGQLVYAKKKTLMASSMVSEVNLLTNRLNRISEADRRTRDFTFGQLKRALIEYVACLPIYRTYVEGEEPGDVDERDRQYIERAIARAERRSLSINRSVYRFLRDILLLRHRAHVPVAERWDQIEFVRKLQQVSGAITAKSIEDTAFYDYVRLVSLCEVGSDPMELGVPIERFHQMNRERLADWPGSFNATSTHDTKRSGDVRLRIDALSEIAPEWAERVARWSAMNREHKTEVDGAPAPDAKDELFLYQTLVGVYPDREPPKPDFSARLGAYLEKALREAKVHSSWTNPDEAYETATRDFAFRLVASRAFLDDFVPLVKRVAAAARRSSLSQSLLKIAAPGVPDVYQGHEIEDLSLVDPDNRRPIDFALRARLLDETKRGVAEDPAAWARRVAQPGALGEGRAKLLLYRQALRFRREHPALFLAGEYRPLQPLGHHAEHLIAFARVHDGEVALALAPVRVLALLDHGRGSIAWQARVPLDPDLRGRYVDVVTGQTIDARTELDVAACLANFPVALLRRG